MTPSSKSGRKKAGDIARKAYSLGYADAIKLEGWDMFRTLPCYGVNVTEVHRLKKNEHGSKAVFEIRIKQL